MADSGIKIGITMGDPAGIGPEIVVKALRRLRVTDLGEVKYVVYGDQRALDTAAASSPGQQAEHEVVSVGAMRWVSPGNPSAAGGRASFRYVEAAVQDALDGKIGALVTGPVSKAVIRSAGIDFVGHTEYLAQKTNTETPVMMLTGGRLRVALATTHCAYRDVPGLITEERLLKIIRIVDDSLTKYFAVPNPQIAVCGLNPHAGEMEEAGSEESEKIAPAVKKALDEGVACYGPLSADTVFHRALQGEYDAVVAMYHDQGLAPLKTVAFQTAVNVTLGLPIIRTSVGHGTAFDIAAKGLADAGSMVEAVRTAVQMVGASRNVTIPLGRRRSAQ